MEAKLKKKRKTKHSKELDRVRLDIKKLIDFVERRERDHSERYSSIKKNLEPLVYLRVDKVARKDSAYYQAAFQRMVDGQRFAFQTLKDIAEGKTDSVQALKKHAAEALASVLESTRFDFGTLKTPKVKWVET